MIARTRRHEGSAIGSLLSTQRNQNKILQRGLPLGRYICIFYASLCSCSCISTPAYRATFRISGDRREKRRAASGRSILFAASLLCKLASFFQILLDCFLSIFNREPVLRLRIFIAKTRSTGSSQSQAKKLNKTQMTGDMLARDSLTDLRCQSCEFEPKGRNETRKGSQGAL